MNQADVVALKQIGEFSLQSGEVAGLDFDQHICASDVDHVPIDIHFLSITRASIPIFQGGMEGGFLHLTSPLPVAGPLG
jgi:hypothetical protein